MRHLTIRKILAYALPLLTILQSCVDDSYLTNPLPIKDQSFTESFDDYQEAYNKGWRAINRSIPTGRKWLDVTETPIITSPNYVAIYYPGWNQAQFTLDSLQYIFDFPKRYWENAYSSQKASNGYVATSLASAELVKVTGANTKYDVNNWLVSPEVVMQNGDKISFYTFCKSLARLQLWVNETNTINVGNNVDSSGDFTIKLVDINANYDDTASNPIKAFPKFWTRFEGEVKGLKKPVRGRFAFRYLLKDRGPSISITSNEIFDEIHQSVIGIDEVKYTGIH